MNRVLVVDDHPIVRQGVTSILEGSGLSLVCDEAESIQEAVRKAEATTYVLALLDVSLPDGSGLQLLDTLQKSQPKLPALVLSMHAEEEFAIQAILSGAAGYLTKQSAPTELVGAVRKLLSGGKYISPSLAEGLANYISTWKRPGLPHDILSERENQILCMIGAGMTQTAISKELFISIKTVSTHRTRILQKLQLKSTSELMHYAAKYNLLR